MNPRSAREPAAAPRLPGETPIESAASNRLWGSDAIADSLRALGVPYVTLNPGSSFRGLHDSLVNHIGNEAPQMILCLHEEHAVAVAHGYAKVTDSAMAVAIHSNVGLMHASMALFNAYCDRVPMLVVGATGPLDAARRRPWIDWLHTATDQAALVRPFLKWDDQPLSVEAAVEAIMQAHRLTSTSPKAPTYVCLDVSIQEGDLDPAAARWSPSPERFGASSPPAPDPSDIARLLEALEPAQRIALLIGRTTRDIPAWDARIELAERLGAAVFTHRALPAAFPTAHELHAAAPQSFASLELQDTLRGADVILALDWLDLGGTLTQTGAVEGVIAAVSMDSQLHTGWGKESLTPVAADIHIHAGIDATVDALLRELPNARRESGWRSRPMSSAPVQEAPHNEQPILIGDIAHALRVALAGTPSCLVRVPLSWDAGMWEVANPLDVLGGDGGEGVGSGPGMTIGAALALRDSDRLVVSVLGDGDYLMGVNALWTAAHYGLALLIVVANNRSFFNDELHQHRVAMTRGRPVENRWIGQRIGGPDVDLAGLATAQGLRAHGPVSDLAALTRTLASAAAEARDGAAVVVDVLIESVVPREDEESLASRRTRR